MRYCEGHDESSHPGPSGLHCGVSDGGMGSLETEYPCSGSPVAYHGSPVSSSLRSRSSSPHAPFSPSDRGRDYSPSPSDPLSGRNRGKGRGTVSPMDLVPSRGRRKGTGRGRGTGRGSRGRRENERDESPPPVTFPNVMYSFSNPPPFIGQHQGPNFSWRDPSSVNALTYFSLFLDDALLEHIAAETNRYAQQGPYNRINYHWCDASANDIKQFLGIIISTGLISLPDLRDYWKTKPIFGQPAIVAGMSRNRFEQLCGRLHFNNNAQAPAHGTDSYDRLYKIRPILQ